MESQYLVHKLAHALAGCVAGAAAGGACVDGAIGGAIGEVVAETFKGKQPAWDAPESEWLAFDAQVKAYSKLIAGSVSAYTGGDAQTAITTAEVAVENNGRIALRQLAMQQQVSGPQYWLNVRAQSLQQAIVANGGTVSPNLTSPGARVNFTQSEVAAYEATLRGLSPHHQLLYSQPSATLSPLPASYIYMQYSVNTQNLSARSGTNAFGFNRDSNGFFRELLRTNPQLFSQENVTLINRGLNPTVDAQWYLHNPSHRAFEHAQLVHHHWMQGPMAVAVPQPLHRDWSNSFHPYR